MKKRSGSSLENVDAAPRHTQRNQNEEAAVDNSCQLDLGPRPVDPRKSEGSVESEDYDAIQQWASDGTVTAKSEPAPHCDSEDTSTDKSLGRPVCSVQCA